MCIRDRTVMVLLHLGRLGEAAMMMQDGLGKARRAAREVDGSVFVLSLIHIYSRRRRYRYRQAHERSVRDCP